MRYLFFAICIFCSFTYRPALANQSLGDHICNISSSALTSRCPVPLTSTIKFFGARSDPGAASGPINIWGECRYIDNISDTTKKPVSLFIPFKTAEEWKSFINNAPSDSINLVSCAKSEKKYLTPNKSCQNPQPKNKLVTLPYTRYYKNSSNVKVEREALFRCKNSLTGKEFWQEVKATFEASSSSSKSSNWRMIDVNYETALWKNTW